MRREALSVALGAIVAVAVVSSIMNLQAASISPEPAQMMASKDLASESPQAADRGPSHGTAYLSLVFSLLSAVLVYQASSLLLTRERLR